MKTSVNVFSLPAPFADAALEFSVVLLEDEPLPVLVFPWTPAAEVVAF